MRITTIHVPSEEAAAKTVVDLSGNDEFIKNESASNDKVTVLYGTNDPSNTLRKMGQTYELTYGGDEENIATIVIDKGLHTDQSKTVSRFAPDITNQTQMPQHFTKREVWSAEAVEAVCNQMNLYTEGANRDADLRNMLLFVQTHDPTDENLYQVALDVTNHSHFDTDTPEFAMIPKEELDMAFLYSVLNLLGNTTLVKVYEPTEEFGKELKDE